MRALIVIALTFLAFAGQAQASCTKPKQEGCWEVVAFSVMDDPQNETLASVGSGSQEEFEGLGPTLWHAQHAGQVQTVPGSYLVFLWDFTPPTEGLVSFRVAAGDEIQVTYAEDVTGQVTPAELEGYGKPKAYRITTTGRSASIILPHAAFGQKPFVIICREGKDGKYPNTMTAQQGRAIAPETMWWQWKGQGDHRFRTLQPFIVVRQSSS